MGKKKFGSKESFNDSSPVRNVRFSSNGTTIEKYSKTSENSISRSWFSCNAVITSFVLVALLSISIGLILIEKNVISDTDLAPSLVKNNIFEETKSTETSEKGPIIENQNINLEIPVKSDSFGAGGVTNHKEKMDSPTTEEPPLKKMKPQETVSGASSKETSEEAAQVEETPDTQRDKKLADIEKQIVIEKSAKDDSATLKPSTFTTENPNKQQKSPPAETEKVEGSTPVPSERPDEIVSGKTDNEISLADLYMEVESIADDILQEDPENDMVKQLAPHLEGVLKNLEGGKESGLRESLLHIKTILIDLKQRLDEARNKKPPKETTHGERIPVDEVIPDPVYIAPRGKTGQEKVGKVESEKIDTSERKTAPKDKPRNIDQRVPVNEVIPDPVYIAPLGKERNIETNEGSTSEEGIQGKQKDSKVKHDVKRESKDKDQSTVESGRPASRETVKTDGKSKKSVPEAKKGKDEPKPTKPVEEKQINAGSSVPERSKVDNEKQQSQNKQENKESMKEKNREEKQSGKEKLKKEEKQNKEEKLRKPDTKFDSHDSKTREQISRTETEKRETRKKVQPSSNLEKDEQFEERLKQAEGLSDEKLNEALNLYGSLLQEKPQSAQALLGRAKTLDKLSEKEKSNARLEQAIYAYRAVLEVADEDPSLVPKSFLREAGMQCAKRMVFRGLNSKGIRVLQRLLLHFPNDVEIVNKIGLYHLIMNDNVNAKEHFETALKLSPEDGFASVHYGFILKVLDNNYSEAIHYLEKGIHSRVEGVVDSRFYYHLGDALQRLGQTERAYEIYDEGVEKGLFLSRYQRSTYNVERLAAKPFWTKEDTTYAEFFKKLEVRWLDIKEEGIKALNVKKVNGSKVGFRGESENLKEVGQWDIFDLFVRGKKNTENCKITPITCSIVESFLPAAGCRRGQSKFSVMEPGTHVYPHTGPTNCRLRSHLGLITPKGAYMRVGNKTLQWDEGKLLIFDDSFEHEVWHQGDQLRLILIVDVWHPELTQDEKQTLKAI